MGGGRWGRAWRVWWRRCVLEGGFGLAGRGIGNGREDGLDVLVVLVQVRDHGVEAFLSGVGDEGNESGGVSGGGWRRGGGGRRTGGRGG